jgi:gas vesicle protein
MTDDRERSHRADLEGEVQAERRKWESTSFLTGLALGAVIGAGLALIFAPASGDETRRLVRKRARSLSREAATGLVSARDEARQALREKKEALRARLVEGVERAEEKLGL